MDTTSLSHFLINGMLGPLMIGSLQRDVASLLGPPVDVSVSQKPRIWKYGSLQLAFDTQGTEATCCFIGLYFRDDTFDIPAQLGLTGWWPSVGATLSQFRDYAATNRVALSDYQPLTFDDQITIISARGVTVAFALDGRGEWVLDSIQCIPKAAANKAVNPSGGSGGF